MSNMYKDFEISTFSSSVISHIKVSAPTLFDGILKAIAETLIYLYRPQNP